MFASQEESSIRHADAWALQRVDGDLSFGA